MTQPEKQETTPEAMGRLLVQTHGYAGALDHLTTLLMGAKTPAEWDDWERVMDWLRQRPETPLTRPIPSAVYEAARKAAQLLGGDPDSVHVLGVREEGTCPRCGCPVGGPGLAFADGTICDDASHPSVPLTSEAPR